MNTKKIATLVAMFYTIFLTGTVQADEAGNKFSQADRHQSLSGQIEAEVNVFGCGLDNVEVYTSHYTSEYTDTAPYDSSSRGYDRYQVQISIRTAEGCGEETEYWYGSIVPDNFTNAAGVIEVSGTFEVWNDEHSEMVPIVLDVTITVDPDGVRGYRTNASHEWKPDGSYRSEYQSNGLWAETVAEGYLNIGGSDVRVDGQTGRMDLNWGQSSQESSEPLNGGGGGGGKG